VPRDYRFIGRALQPHTEVRNKGGVRPEESRTLVSAMEEKHNLYPLSRTTGPQTNLFTAEKK